jgi:hypothetical protein
MSRLGSHTGAPVRRADGGRKAVIGRGVRRVAFLLVLLLAGAGGMVPPALAASPDDAVRARFANDFAAVLDGYDRLGKVAVAGAAEGLVPLGTRWAQEMTALDARLAPHEATFFPLMYRPWTREAAVFSNLEGARMWLWSIHDALRDGAAGVESIDLAGGRVRAELIANFSAYLEKARTLLEGGRFAGSYFEDTLTPILADYCAYPEGGERVRPEFDDPRLFDDVSSPAVAALDMMEEAP